MSASCRRKWVARTANPLLANPLFANPLLANPLFALSLLAITLLATATHLFAPAPAVAEPPAALKDFRPDRLVRFATRAEAEQRRERLIRFIWPDGLPTRAASVSVDSPQTPEQRLALLAGPLRGLDATSTEQLYALDANLPRYDFSTRLYLVAPVNSRKPKAQLLVIHQGHQGGLGDGIAELANAVLARGWHVLIAQMPLVGWNRDNTVKIAAGPERTVKSHDDIFAQFATSQEPLGAPFQLFLEPIVQGVNHFVERHPETKSIAIAGLSGGGWATHMAAALDTRIQTSFPVAGAFPMYARHFSAGSIGDAEQTFAPLYGEEDSDDADTIADTATGAASWLEIFALGGLGDGRQQIQILNHRDTCCFHGDVYETYSGFLERLVERLKPGRWQVHSDRTHQTHSISPAALEKVILPVLTQDRP
jgi:hypothetical protein